MHISEGVLSPEILVAGAVLTAAGAGVGFKGIDPEKLPSVGIMSAAFFVVALIHVPIGPASAHLVLNGLLGIILGWQAFPAILVGLVLQALLFQFGGITTLGVNTLNMALPAVMCYYLFKGFLKLHSSQTVFLLAAFTSGFLAVLFSSILVGLSLYLTGEAFLLAAKLIIAAHVPVMIIEGILTSACVLFLRKVKPEMLEEGHA